MVHEIFRKAFLPPGSGKLTLAKFVLQAINATVVATPSAKSLTARTRPCGQGRTSNPEPDSKFHPQKFK